MKMKVRPRRSSSLRPTWLASTNESPCVYGCSATSKSILCVCVCFFFLACRRKPVNSSQSTPPLPFASIFMKRTSRSSSVMSSASGKTNRSACWAKVTRAGVRGHSAYRTPNRQERWPSPDTVIGKVCFLHGILVATTDLEHIFGLLFRL